MVIQINQPSLSVITQMARNKSLNKEATLVPYGKGKFYLATRQWQVAAYLPSVINRLLKLSLPPNHKRSIEAMNHFHNQVRQSFPKVGSAALNHVGSVEKLTLGYVAKVLDKANELMKSFAKEVTEKPKAQTANNRTATSTKAAGKKPARHPLSPAASVIKKTESQYTTNLKQAAQYEMNQYIKGAKRAVGATISQQGAKIYAYDMALNKVMGESISERGSKRNIGWRQLQQFLPGGLGFRSVLNDQAEMGKITPNSEQLTLIKAKAASMHLVARALGLFRSNSGTEAKLHAIAALATAQVLGNGTVKGMSHQTIEGSRSLEPMWQDIRNAGIRMAELPFIDTTQLDEVITAKLNQS